MAGWLKRLFEEVEEREPTVRPPKAPDYVDIVFTGPPGPDTEAHFVEVEDPRGYSMRLGEWLEREDGYWVLRIRKEDWPT